MLKYFNMSEISSEVAVGKDSTVSIIEHNGQKNIQKIYDSSRFPQWSSEIKEYVEFTNAGNTELTEKPLTINMLGRDLSVDILPIKDVIWNEQKKAWTTTSPYVEGSNLLRLYSEKIDDEQQIVWSRDLPTKDNSPIPSLDPAIPEKLNMDEYFNFLNSVTVIEENIAARLGIPKIHIGMENIMLTADNRLVITDLGHDIKKLNLKPKI